MARNQPVAADNVDQAARKLLLSSMVVGSFFVYAVIDHVIGAADTPAAASDVSPVTAGTSPVAPSDSGASNNSTQPSQPSVSGSAQGSSAQPSAQPATPTRAPAVSRPGPTATPTRKPLPTATATPVPAKNTGLYKDGDYVGPSTNAFYGTVQVKAVIRGGQISDVQFLDYPHYRNTSMRINTIVMPYLQQEAIQAQNAQVDLISGATLTSQAFVRSLQAALAKAKN